MHDEFAACFAEAKAINRKAGRPIVRYSTLYHQLVPWWYEYDDDAVDGALLGDDDLLHDDYSEESFP